MRNLDDLDILDDLDKIKTHFCLNDGVHLSPASPDRPVCPVCPDSSQSFSLISPALSCPDRAMSGNNERGDVAAAHELTELSSRG